MYRTISRMWDLVPSFYVRATEKSFAVGFGKNQLFRTELPAIVRLDRLYLNVPDYFYTALHKSRLLRTVLKRNYRQRWERNITIIPKVWWALVVLSVFFYPLTIVMAVWIFAIWLVLCLSHEAAQIITRVTGRLLEDPFRTFISVISNLSRGVLPSLVTKRAKGESVPPYMRPNIQPRTLEGGSQSPYRYKPANPWWFNPPSELGSSLPEGVGTMFRQHGQLPRAAPLGPLPKNRRRRPKAVVNRTRLEAN